MAAPQDKKAAVKNTLNDPLLLKIVAYLQKTYHCHTVILYGSRARNEATKRSDYDILAIRKVGEIKRNCRLFNGFYLDAFIYPEKIIKHPDLSLIRMKDGIVLCQKNKLGDQLLSKIKRLFRKGAPKIPAAEKQAVTPWAYKMLNRAKEGDVEGDFRRHWLLYDLLIVYFQLRDVWYLGPKESFKWLQENDILAYNLFKKALKPNASLTSIKKLIEKISLKTESVNT